MQVLATQEIASDIQDEIASRSKIYLLLAELFRYPDADFIRQARQGEIQEALEDLFARLPYPFAWEAAEMQHLEKINAAGDEEIEVEYIRLFEAGPGNPPFALLEGIYREDRQAIMKELILFYNHFGLSYAEGKLTDRPDHLFYEMEFLHFLTFKELMAVNQEKDPGPYRRAQKDFLERHPLKWIGALTGKISSVNHQLPGAGEACLEVFWFYSALIRMAWRFLNADSRHLQNLLDE